MTTVSFMRRDGRGMAAQVYPSGSWRPAVARRALLAAALLVASVGAGAQPLPVDRLVAVVEQRALMQSDVELALRLGSIEPPAPDVPPPVEQLVKRELVRLEVDRFAVADPPADAVERRLAERAGGQPVDAWLEALAAFGVPPAGIRRRVADDLRIETYLEQRFGAAAQPTEVEVVERARAEGAGVPVPDGALAAARAALARERRARLVADWVDGLRRRAAVHVVPAP
jgi:hypothetical protein